jgi:TetR/AcrR family transcriptional regulator, tetracycline repressor protein
VLGSIALEIADVHESGALPPETQRTADRRRAFSAMSVDRYPLSAAAADTVAGHISTEQYL